MVKKVLFCFIHLTNEFIENSIKGRNLHYSYIIPRKRNMDYSLMAGECRMIFFTSCEESQMNERDTSKQVGESSQEVNKNRTSEPTMKLVFVLRYYKR